MESLYIGFDVGAISVKAVVLDGAGKVLFHKYVRHQQAPLPAGKEILREVKASFPEASFRMAVTGVKEAADFFDGPFLSVQESLLLFKEAFLPSASAVLELGGESSRLTYFHPSIVQRENRGCAGGTGAFLDNLACLFGTDTAGLEGLAEKGKEVYPIASRCGVYAKTDVQGLLNEGASKEDLALSVFHGLAYQAVSDLLRGRAVTGPAALLGGPFEFLPRLRDAFYDLLGVEEKNRLPVSYASLYGALGAAIFARDGKRPSFPEQWQPAFLRRWKRKDDDRLLPPLFAGEAELSAFCDRHGKAKVPVEDAREGEALWLGIDAGSTTLKAVLINEKGHIVLSSYGRHGGEVVEKAASMVKDLLRKLPPRTHVAAAGVTGYGEELVRTALGLDFGKVETMAHLKAARSFCPDLTSLLDIGGQDMKYMHLTGGQVDQVLMNGACSSGCGAFLETFAGNMGLTPAEFGEEALQAGPFPHYGAHCTVFMNSRIHRGKNQAKDRKALAAGLCYGVVENALTRVLDLKSPDELGPKIVVEGGTFYNDAVLRAFEKITGREVIRPDASGLMGAYGVALYGLETYAGNHISTMIGMEDMEHLTFRSETRLCHGCGNQCRISIYDFGGGRLFGTGNRCETGAALIPGRKQEKLPNLMQWVKDHVFRKRPLKGERKGVVGIPAVLSQWNDFPFWAAFWAELGYEVRLSHYSERAVEKTASTIPRRVHCHPCLLAHAHVQELLGGKPDFIWFPAMRRGKKGNGTDEWRHARYSRILGVFMRRNIREAGVPYLSPSLPELTDPDLAGRLAAVLPFDRKVLETAVAIGRENLIAYEIAYAFETEKALHFCESSGKKAILFLARSFQSDPLIHKGLPNMVTALGAPVLTAEGISCLQKGPGIGRMGGDFIDAALSCISGKKYLLPVPLRSSSCGMDREAFRKAEHLFKEEGRPRITLTLDQGTNTGALKIRVRTLLEEYGERQK